MPKAYPAACRLARFFLTGCLVLGGSTLVSAAPTVTKMLEYKPRQEASITTPAPADQAACKVDLQKAAKGSAWVLKDSAGRMLRRFYAGNERNIDTWSYYKDGVEVLRETDTTGSGRPDQYRWLNAGGSKWGVDVDKDGKIDAWKVISPEEVSQEVLRALGTRNFARLQALMITDEDIRSLGLPKETADSLLERRKNAKAKFDTAISKLTKLTEKTNWIHLELPAPECIPAADIGAKADIVRYARGTVLFESGGSNEWFQTGAMIQVGTAWKLIDAPVAGATTIEEGKDGSRTMDLDPKVQKLVEELTAHDKKVTAGSATVKQHLDRADILEKIVAAVKAQERDPWIRQVADSLASAAQISGKTETSAATRLNNLEAQLTKHMPGANLTAYVAFRNMQADYSRQLAAAGGKDFEKIQKAWLEKLTAFVKAYPKAEDTADVMLQLGMVCEFLGKDVEAKNWYATLAKDHPNTAQGRKGAGSAERLSLEGKVMQVVGPTLSNPGTSFDIAALKGKIVIVYYWASWNGQAASDFAKLKTVLTTHKDVALVCVNLDQTATEAKSFLQKNPVEGTHLHQAGGLDSPLATQYGVMVLPSLFVVGKDGKCVSKSAQVGTVEDEIKKLTK